MTRIGEDIYLKQKEIECKINYKYTSVDLKFSQFGISSAHILHSAIFLTLRSANLVLKLFLITVSAKCCYCTTRPSRRQEFGWSILGTYEVIAMSVRLSVASLLIHLTTLIMAPDSFVYLLLWRKWICANADETCSQTSIFYISFCINTCHKKRS